MNETIIFLMDVSLTGDERGRSTVTRFRNLASVLAYKEINVYWFSCKGRKRILEKKSLNSVNDYVFHSKLKPIYPFILVFCILFSLPKIFHLKIICYFPSLREGLPSFFLHLLSFGRIDYYIDYMDLSPNILSSKSKIRFFEFFLEKTIVSRAKGISVISPFLFQWTRSLGGPSTTICLIPLSISDIKGNHDQDKLDSFDSKLSQIEISERTKKWIKQIKNVQNRFLIGYQGSIHPHQGLESLLEAFSDKRLHSFYLLLAGGADTNNVYENEIKTVIKQINKNYSHEKIKITGYLKSKDIQTIISLFDFGIIPKPQSILSEATFPSKSLRYLIEGIPIIATPSGWLKELVINTGGILIKDNSVDSIIKGILSIKEKRRLDKDHLKYIDLKFNTAQNLSSWVRFLEL